MLKRIGIPAYRLGPNSFGITSPYMEFIETFGEPVILHPNTPVMDNLDLLILPGGPDVDSWRYSQYPGPFTQAPSTTLEWFDRQKLPAYIDNGTPIFGICRGLQTLVVHFGGELLQHVIQETNSENDRSDLVHTLTPIEDSIADLPFKPQAYKENDKNKQIHVNSLHHQAAREKKLPDALKADYTSMGYSKGTWYRLAEAIRHKSLNIAAVQWHPRFLGLN